ncbi:MAG: glutamate-5-semialdehyde dehydrogenase [Prevotella sp.]|nr:glutamate-5-semialdehyde dehydrogenase [Prevotella sp.]MBQ8628380.1 glutamate-5-semialdehyde dehydrogenase [Prevotella sp.]
MVLEDIFKKVKDASKTLNLISDETRNVVLNSVADAIIQNKDYLLEANANDLARMDKKNPLYDRLQLTEQRLNDIASDMRHVSNLPSPLGRILVSRTLPNGLQLTRRSVPFGVIGIIYEARPNVSFDVFSLCFKSGNACILKGGKDADASNKAIVALIHDVLKQHNINPSVVELLPATHEATAEMLIATSYVDVCIPRGGKKLIQFVRDNAKIPVIETGAGVVNTYFDEYGDINKGKDIINNAKTRRVSVCNALDCLIIHHARLNDLASLCEPLTKSNVIIYADSNAFDALCGKYPEELLKEATEESFGTEFMDYAMAVKTVKDITEAITHIDQFGSGHSECIITENRDNATLFQNQVDAACVYVNAPTSFTDGAQFGLGAEIGISTQKLGARGPMGLEEITTYKWLIEGEGQIRK